MKTEALTGTWLVIAEVKLNSVSITRPAAALGRGVVTQALPSPLSSAASNAARRPCLPVAPLAILWNTCMILHHTKRVHFWWAPPPTHPPTTTYPHTHFFPRTIKGWVLFSPSMLLSCSYITVFDPKVNWDLKSSSAVEIMRIWHVLLTSGQNLWLSQAAMSLFVWHTFRTGRSSGTWLSKTGRLKQLI